jgi:hypothetical protein
MTNPVQRLRDYRAQLEAEVQTPPSRQLYGCAALARTARVERLRSRIRSLGSEIIKFEELRKGNDTPFIHA